MNDPKVFKFVENDLVIGNRSRSGLGLGLGLTAIRRGFKLYECLLVLTASLPPRQ